MSTRVLSTQISLSHSCRGARGQHAACPIDWSRYCLASCARGASRTSSPPSDASSPVALKTWPPRRASRSRRPSRRRPIGKLLPGRGRAATQIRREQLVQDSPARPTQHRQREQKPWRWIIIIIRGERVVGFPFHPHMQQVHHPRLPVIMYVRAKRSISL